MTKKLWGGRFGKKTDPLVEEFTKSIDYDYKLAEPRYFQKAIVHLIPSQNLPHTNPIFDLPALGDVTSARQMFRRTTACRAVVADVEPDEVAERMSIGALHVRVRPQHLLHHRLERYLLRSPGPKR